ncbi:hypothetical protein FRC09_016998 [Ceratobasidium sp. 395]|nr:hypothetical protein FRC09_016998 [Ceratobasidium sp. 395]
MSNNISTHHCGTNHDGVCFLMKPTKLPGGFQADHQGLIFEGHHRCSKETILAAIDTDERGPLAESSRSLTWWLAQCRFFDLSVPESPFPHDLRTAIRQHLASGGDFPRHILQMEAAAQADFLNSMRVIQAVIKSTRRGSTVPTPGVITNPTESLNEAYESLPSPPAATASLHGLIIEPCTYWSQYFCCAATHSISESVTDDELLPPSANILVARANIVDNHTTLEQPQPQDDARENAAPLDHSSRVQDSRPTNQSIASQSHNRGGQNAVPNTQAARKSKPGTSLLEAFLAKLISDPNNKLLIEGTRLTSKVVSMDPQMPPAPTGLPTPGSPGVGQDTVAQGLLWATRCLERDNNTNDNMFTLMLSMAELAVWKASASQAPDGPKTNREAWEMLMGQGLQGVGQSAFGHWLIDDGYKILRLAWASSIHVISALAAAVMRTAINNHSKQVIHNVENLLRNPFSATDVHDSIREMLVTHIQHFHLPMKRTFPNGIELGGVVLGVDWKQDDLFFEALFTRKPDDLELLPRAWYWLSEPIHYAFPSVLSTAPTPEDRFSLKTVSTNFDPALPQNYKLPNDFCSEERTLSWTARQREIAAQAERPDTLEEFKVKYQAMHEQGHKGDGGYIYLSKELDNILIQGKDDVQSNMIALVLARDTVSKPQADQLHSHIRLLNKDFPYEDIDTKALGPKHEWPACHITIWNRYAWAAKNHPGTDHVRERMANRTQSQPYEDQSILRSMGGADPKYSEHCDFAMVTDSIHTTLVPVIEKLERYIPQLLAEHQKLFVSLSPAFKIGCQPFCMFVLNTQPLTHGHRDDTDNVDSFCLIMALGDFSGGELCLYEPGMVIELVPGAFAVIRSKRDVHFNLHFKGRRMSIVFTSDGDLKRWEEDQNGWLRPKNEEGVLRPSV